MRLCTESAAALSLVLALACNSAPDPQSEPADPIPAGSAPLAEASVPAWTQTFRAPAVLVARQVTIEGPVGLREHVALTIDSAVHEYSVRTVPEGLLQELSLKPGVDPDAVVLCVLDSLQIAAEQSVRVLERPGEVPVVVVATGDATWQTPDGQERRGETLRLVGQPAVRQEAGPQETGLGPR